MKVILSEDVENLGAMGATVKVADGYARNYLIPRKLAVGADSATAKQIQHETAIIKRREDKRRTELSKFAKQLEGVTVDIKMRSGEEDKLFGSVTNAMIAEKLHELGHDVDKKTIHMDEPIKSLGIFTVPVKLGSGIEAKVKVWVSSIVEAAPAAEENA
jgi:large subunit ribosomal protein L9